MKTPGELYDALERLKAAEADIGKAQLAIHHGGNGGREAAVVGEVMTTLNDTERRSIAASLRVMMNTVDEFEKKTGKGGWYAETMQENCTFIAKLCGIGRYPEFQVGPTAGPQQAG